MGNKDNIVLIGMPGAGKSTLGVVAAKVLGYDFVDGDLLIQNHYHATLQQLIDEHGPDAFIEMENDILRSLDVHHTVIAPGGSAIYSDQAMAHLAQMGHVVYVHVSLEELEKRLGGLHERGVVSQRGEHVSLASLYEERVDLYERWAEITVDTDGLDTREAVMRMIEALREVNAL